MGIGRTTHQQRLIRVLAVAGLAITLSGATPAAASAAVQETSGTCVGGEFTSTPPPGSAVPPGGLIVYHVTVIVEGGSVLGCARDIKLSPLLRFVSVKPAGNYWPDATEGPIATIDFDGPIEEGTTLSGDLTMRVRSCARPGATIEASSGDVIQHVVAKCKKHRKGHGKCNK